jgi:phage shock protein A
MQIAQRPTSSGIAAPSGSKTSSTSKVDSTGLLEQSAAPEQTAAVGAAAPVARRGLSNWDQPLQDDISGAQQAVDFLEQSAAQLRALKAELSAKLANRQGRDGQVEARVRQFSDTWRSRQDASGGTLDSQLSYSSNESQQRFKVRGMTMSNLRHGARETLAIAVGNGAQGLRSVQLEPGLSDDEILARFNQALAPVNISVSQGDNGDLEFSTPESNWTNVRDTLAIQGGGIRYPTGQLNRVRTDPEPPIITPEHWHTNDTEALRQTLQQVVQALAHVEAALSKVNLALSDASQRANSAMPQVSAAGMDQAAQNFVSAANEPSYASLLSLTSALTGINRERVMALLGLRM